MKASSLPLGAKIECYSDYKVVSAGHHKHEYATGYAFDEIYKFFKEIEATDPDANLKY